MVLTRYAVKYKGVEHVPNWVLFGIPLNSALKIAKTISSLT